MIRVAINGFGRIGRQAFKVWFDRHREEMSIVAVNDLTDAAVLAHLLKYDSVYGNWNHDVGGQKLVDDIKTADDGQQVGKLAVDGQEIAVYGTKKAMMTTIHAVTAEQNLVDGPPPGGKSADLRRARAAYVNIIPTTTGAAIATGEAIPALSGKFDGVALRVPVICGSISDFTFLLKTRVTVEVVNRALSEAARGALAGILAVSDEPLVSSDIIGRSESSIVDLSLTRVVDGDMVKVFAWYDNEFGYSNRLIEQVIKVGNA